MPTPTPYTHPSQGWLRLTLFWNEASSEDIRVWAEESLGLTSQTSLSSHKPTKGAYVASLGLTEH